MSKMINEKEMPSHLKTDHRGYVFVLTDFVRNLDHQLTKRADSLCLDESHFETYTLSYLLMRCIQAQRQDHKIVVEDPFYVKSVRNGMNFDRLVSFRLRLNLPDADVCMRVGDDDGRCTAKLFLGRGFAHKLTCANGAYLYLLNQLYQLASDVQVAS